MKKYGYKLFVNFSHPDSALERDIEYDDYDEILVTLIGQPIVFIF